MSHECFYSSLITHPSLRLRDVLQLLALVHESIHRDAVLLLVQRPVFAAERHQLAMRSAFGDAAFFEYEDLIGVADRREAMRDDERRPVSHQRDEAVLNHR